MAVNSSVLATVIILAVSILVVSGLYVAAYQSSPSSGIFGVWTPASAKNASTSPFINVGPPVTVTTQPVILPESDMITNLTCVGGTAAFNFTPAENISIVNGTQFTFNVTSIAPPGDIANLTQKANALAAQAANEINKTILSNPQKYSNKDNLSLMVNSIVVNQLGPKLRALFSNLNGGVYNESANQTVLANLTMYHKYQIYLPFGNFTLGYPNSPAQPNIISGSYTTVVGNSVFVRVCTANYTSCQILFGSILANCIAKTSSAPPGGVTPPPVTTASWSGTTPYPEHVSGQSCVQSGSSMYCIGGANDTATSSLSYYATLSTSGIGSWSPMASYPMGIAGQSCVAYGNYVYCMGGTTESGNPGASVSSAFYSGISPSGISGWTSTTPYPQNVTSSSCAAYAGYVYCVGGENMTGDPQNSTASAPLQSSGIGTWSSSTPYPENISGQSCVAANSNIYCIGGTNSVLGITTTADSYYAPITSPGVLGAWKATTSYPIPITNSSCASIGSDSVVCVGGENDTGITNRTYSASLTSTGISAWSRGSDYQTPLNETTSASCVGYNGYAYCVAGTSSQGPENYSYYLPPS